MSPSRIALMPTNGRRYQGEVRFWLEKPHFGFVSWTDGEGQRRRTFCHGSEAQGHVRLTRGIAVSFELEPDHDGRLKAVRVISLDGGA